MILERFPDFFPAPEPPVKTASIQLFNTREVKAAAWTYPRGTPFNPLDWEMSYEPKTRVFKRS